ncbi:MAG: hypothetical protein AAB573_01470 [Patescibacteria group bacterium]
MLTPSSILKVTRMNRLNGESGFHQFGGREGVPRRFDYVYKTKRGIRHPSGFYFNRRAGKELPLWLSWATDGERWHVAATQHDGSVLEYDVHPTKENIKHFRIVEHTLAPHRDPRAIYP